MSHPVPRTRLAGPVAIRAALDGGEPLRLVLVREGVGTPQVTEVAERARAAGVPVRVCGESVLWRFSTGPDGRDVLGLVGPDPGTDLEGLMAHGGAVWLLTGVRYPGNAGFAIRTAEVSGADGIVIDDSLDRDGRRAALRASMRADRLLPVLRARASESVAAARAAGKRVIAVEDVGDRAPWDADLTGPTLLVIGGEHDGIPREVVDACDEVVRIPMAGFIPSYNLQAAMAAVAVERLRQLLD